VRRCIAAAACLVFLMSIAAWGDVTITDDQKYANTSGFLKIKTDNATYYYHKKAGMFGGIVDNDGKDWIGWNTASNQNGLWRGLPKPYFNWKWHLQDKTGNEANVTTTINQASGASGKITSDDGTNKVTWEFFSTHATMTVVKAGQSYYFTYEGAPNGQYDKAKNYIMMGNKDSKHYFKDGAANGDIGKNDGETWEWAFIGDDGSSNALFFVHHEDDSKVEAFEGTKYDGMGVFAFGRDGTKGAKFSNAGEIFSIGIVGSTDKSKIAAAVAAAVAGETGIKQSAASNSAALGVDVVRRGNELVVNTPFNDKCEISLYSPAGKQLVSRAAPNATIDMSSLPHGAFIVTATHNGKRYQSKPIAF